MPDHTNPHIELRHLGWIALIFVSIAVGFASLYITIPPIFIGAVILMGVNTLMILKFPFWGLLFYLFIFMYRPGEVYPALAPLRAELLTGALAMLAIVLHQIIKIGRVTVPRDNISVSLVVFLIAILLSSFTSYERSQTITQATEYLKLLVFYYLIVSQLTTRKRFIIFACLYAALIFYIGADAYKEYLAGNFHSRMGVDRLIGSTSAGGDPNALAATLSTAIPLFMAVAMYFRHKLMKLAYFAMGAFMVPLISITGSRSGLIALMTVIFAGVSYSRHRIALLVTIVVLLAAGWTVLPAQYQARYERFGEVTTDLNEASSGRWDIWKTGLQMCIDRPILGIGAGAFLWAHVSGDFGASRWLEAHNLYIEIFATTGIIGFASWMTFLYLFIKQLKILRAEVRKRPKFKWMTLFANSYMVVLIALLVSGMFGHNLYRYTWYVLAGMTVAMTNILAVDALEEKDRVEPALPKTAEVS